MSEQTTFVQRYVVTIYEPAPSDGTLIFTFKPKGLMQERGPNGIPKPVPKFIVSVRQNGGLTFDWNGSQDDPGVERRDMEAEVAVRLKDRNIWLDRVTSLVGHVERWSKEMGWSTRRIEKQLDDSRIGKHRVPALLMQEGTCRILLEPVGTSTPGAEGSVDLYIMPAYDDVASIYYYGNQWNVHYQSKQAASVLEGESEPLSKETLKKVLGEMIRHAA